MDGNAYDHPRLLLVDDDRVDRMAVRRALREADMDADPHADRARRRAARGL
jgi:hypothetical protein